MNIVMVEWLLYLIAVIIVSLSVWGIIKELKKGDPALNLKKEKIIQTINEEISIERKTEFISPWNTLPKKTVVNTTRDEDRNSGNHSNYRSESMENMDVNHDDIIPNNVNLQTSVNDEKSKHQDKILQLRKELEFLKNDLTSLTEKNIKPNTKNKTVSIKKVPKKKTMGKKYIRKKSNLKTKYKK